MSQVKTAISISERLFQEADQIADEMKIPRSQVVALALEDFVRRYRNKQLLDQINAAHSEPPTEEEIESLQSMRAYQRRLAERDEWK